MHKALYPTGDVERLNVLRKEGYKGFASNKDNVDALMQRLQDYKEKHEGGMITVIRNDTGNTMDKRMIIPWKQKWEK